MENFKNELIKQAKELQDNLNNNKQVIDLMKELSENYITQELAKGTPQKEIEKGLKAIKKATFSLAYLEFVKQNKTAVEQLAKAYKMDLKGE